MPDVYGIEVPELPDGTQAFDVVVIVKALDPEGELTSIYHASGGLSQWEKIGLLRMYAAYAEAHAVDSSENRSDSEDDE